MNKQLEIKFGLRDELFNKIIKICLVGFVILQFFAVFLINYVKVEHALDYDSSLAIRHVIEMWKNKTIFLEGWNYFSTMEIDSISFFVMPIYFISGNLSLAISVGHGIMYLVFAYILCDIFANMGKSIYCGLLCTFLIFIPYNSGQLGWTNMLFFSVGQYEFRVLTMLLLVDVLLIGDKHKLTYKDKILIILSAIINFWTSLSCGNYILLVVVFPLLLWFLAKGIRSKTWEYKRYQAYILGLNILCSIIGWRLHNDMVGASFNNDKNLITADVFFENIGNAITGIFMLFGGLDTKTDISVLSLTGLVCVLKIAYTIFVIGFVLWCYLKKKETRPLTEMAIMIMLVNLAVLFLTNTSYGAIIFEFRYHIVWVVIALCVSGMIVELYEDMKYGKLIMFLLLIILAVFEILGTNSIKKQTSADINIEEILNIADENNVTTIYLCNMPRETHQIRAKDINTYCLNITMDSDGEIFAKIGDFYFEYCDASNAGDGNMLVIREDEYNRLPELYKDKYKYLKSISSGECVYISETNPWDFISGLPNYQKVSIDYVYSDGYEYDGILEDGKLKVEGNDNFVLWGPYREAKEGVYNITIYCEPLMNKEIQESVADICVNEGGGQLATSTFDENNMAFQMKNVKLEDGMKPEFRIKAGKGETFFVNKLVFEKVE